MFKLVKSDKKYGFDMEKKFDEIYSFLKNMEINNFNALLQIIRHDKNCEIARIHNNNYMFSPVYDKTFQIKIDNKLVVLPIVIKENYQKIGLKNAIFNGKLYIFGFKSLTTEFLILTYVRNLWKKTVHLPLILGYGFCFEEPYVDRIVSIKYGLEYNYEIDISNKILHNYLLLKDIEPIKIFKSNLMTLKDLFIYINYNRFNGLVKLPNDYECLINELFDYLCISYLMTYQLLICHNVYSSYMHSGNIYIHWLNNNSYYGNQNIKNIEEIIYLFNNKYYKIKTFGFVIVFGDMSKNIIKIKDDVILIGNFYDINNYEFIDKIISSQSGNIEFIQRNIKYLTHLEYKKTVAYDILNSEPYYSNLNYYNNNLISEYFGLKIDYINNMKTTEELLKYYFIKYGIEKYINAYENILINVNG